MSDCKACEQRKSVLDAQMEGREAARRGILLKDNPRQDEIHRQYWEYGWIEENFLNEIDEHRAIMDYVGTHLFMLSEEIVEMQKKGDVTKSSGDHIIASLSTVASKLADKLRGN
jgi:hypothetical protein